MTRHFCTIADSKYLNQAIALYLQIDFFYLRADRRNKAVLYFLCLDQHCYDTIELHKTKGYFANVHTYLIDDLEKEHPELLQAKQNPASKYGDQRSQYIWSLTPWFIHYLLTQTPGSETINELMYADADVYFFQPPELIFEKIDLRSVYIHTHRFSGKLQDHLNPDGIGTTLDVGWYNVGVIVFRNTISGMLMVEKWKNWVMDPANQYYNTYGTCGDQKYLELFIHTAGPGNICVFDDEKGIFHQAPWCTENPDNKPLPVFYHFSHFNYDIQADTWKDNIKGEWKPSANAEILSLYLHYFEKIKTVNNWLKHDTNP